MTLEVNDFCMNRGGLKIGPLNFKLDEGRILSIIGKNGSGKTSSLLGIMGIIEKVSGNVNIDGIDASSMHARDVSRKLSLIQQELPVPMSLSVHDIMDIAAYSRDASEEEMNDALETCKISHMDKRDFATLSGGEKRMVSIASAIYQDSRYILMDEPASFLDIDKVHLLSTILKDLKKKGKGIICVMHDINLAASISDQMLLMKSGQVVDYGNTWDVMNVGNMGKIYDAKFRSYDSPEGVRFYPVFS